MDFRGFYDDIIFDVDKPILKSYNAKQGDTKSRGIYVTVTQRNVVIKDLSGLRMRLFYEKPDKTRGFIDGVVVGNKFRIDYTNQMFAVPGVVRVELRLMGADGEIITGRTFKILVDGSIADGSIVSKDERGILDRAFELAEDIIPRLELLDVELLEDVQNEMLQSQLKVAKVEKELNDYKATMQQINIHQSPTQKASGHGIVSLPKNAAEGQVGNVRIKGNTYTNLLGEDGDFSKGIGSWYSARSTISVENSQLKNVADGSTGWGACRYKTNIIVQEGKTYFIRLKVKVTNSLSSAIRIQVTDESFIGGIVKEIKSPVENHVYDVYVKGTTTANLTGNLCLNIVHFYPDANTAKDKVMYIQDVMLVDLDQTGDADKTEEELVEKYPFINGTKSTISAIRIKSVGKNLFDGEVEKGAISQTSGAPVPSSTSMRSKNFIRVKPNTQYRFKHYNSNVGFSYYLYDINKNFITSLSWRSATQWSVTTTEDTAFMKMVFTNPLEEIKVVIAEGDLPASYEPYTENTQYITAKDEEGNILELHSLPNGVKDEIRVSGGKAELVKRVSDEIVIDGAYTNLYNPVVAGMECCYRIQLQNWSVSNNALVNQYGSVYALLNGIAIEQNHSSENSEGIWIHSNNSLYIKIDKTKIDSITGATILDKFKTYLNQNPITLIYQLAEPIITPINVSGNLVSCPSGTVYVGNVVVDAGIYTDKMTVLHQDLPIKVLEKLSKIDYTTGLETELDVSEAVISEDRLSFTHPDLVNGDIVFYTYEYDRESTEGEAEIEYYDSRYVIKDSVTGKFYKWQITVANGVPSIELEEV